MSHLNTKRSTILIHFGDISVYKYFKDRHTHLYGTFAFSDVFLTIQARRLSIEHFFTFFYRQAALLLCSLTGSGLVCTDSAVATLGQSPKVGTVWDLPQRKWHIQLVWGSVVELFKVHVCKQDKSEWPCTILTIWVWPHQTGIVQQVNLVLNCSLSVKTATTKKQKQTGKVREKIVKQGKAATRNQVKPN